MNLNISLKHLSILIIEMFCNQIMQAQTNSIVVKTGYNYQTPALYSSGVSDEYWTLYYVNGNNVFSPVVGKATTVWKDDETTNPANWLNSGGIIYGDYYYRLNFCIDEAVSESLLPVIEGIISTDNIAKSILLDGIEIYQFPDWDCSTGYDSYQYKCFNNFSYTFNDISLLSTGSHLLEIKIHDDGGFTGININAALKNVKGKVFKLTDEPSSACTRKGVIRGTIFYDENCNNEIDSEILLPNVSVQLFTNEGLLIKTVETDANGVYSFYGLDISSYIVKTSYSSPYMGQSVTQYSVSFTSSNTAAFGKNFGFLTGSSIISGKVYLDNNTDATYNSGDDLLANKTVNLWEQTGEMSYQIIESVITNANGLYSFTPRCFNSNYIVNMNVPGGLEVIQPNTVFYSFSDIGCCANYTNYDFGLKGGTNSCSECVPSFSPLPNEEYLLSAWVKEDFTNLYPDTYVNSGIHITFNYNSPPYTFHDDFGVFKPSGPIIDGWQRIEASFVVPSDAHNIQLILENNGPSTINSYFDDIRIHPFRSNMKSFVYNPYNQKVEVILDENNYATFYEYDDEGILVRVKKETERGVMTIKETRNNQSKK